MLIAKKNAKLFNLILPLGTKFIGAFYSTCTYIVFVLLPRRPATQLSHWQRCIICSILIASTTRRIVYRKLYNMLFSYNALLMSFRYIKRALHSEIAFRWKMLVTLQSYATYFNKMCSCSKNIASYIQYSYDFSRVLAMLLPTKVSLVQFVDVFGQGQGIAQKLS